MGCSSYVSFTATDQDKNVIWPNRTPSRSVSTSPPQALEMDRACPKSETKTLRRNTHRAMFMVGLPLPDGSMALIDMWLEKGSHSFSFSDSQGGRCQITLTVLSLATTLTAATAAIKPANSPMATTTVSKPQTPELTMEAATIMMNTALATKVIPTTVTVARRPSVKLPTRTVLKPRKPAVAKTKSKVSKSKKWWFGPPGLSKCKPPGHSRGKPPGLAAHFNPPGRSKWG